MIRHLAERMEFDDKLSQLKMSTGSCNTHCNQCLEDAYMRTVTNEAKSCDCDTVDTSS